MLLEDFMSQFEINDKPAGGAISETLREQLHRREALCRELEDLPRQIRGDYEAQIDRITAEFAAAPELPPEFAELLDKRFAEARRKAEAGRETVQERRRAAIRLAGELEQLAAAGELATYAEVTALEKKFQMFTAECGEVPAELADFEVRLAPLRDRLAAEAAAEAEKAGAAQAIIDELTALTAAEDITPLHDRKNDLEVRFAALGTLPPALQKAYQEAHRKASTRLARHYETLDLARWESYTLKLDICSELEKLLQIPPAELYRAAKPLTELREKWKKLGSVPKEKNDEINARYLELTRQLQHSVDEFFSRRRQEQKQAASDKTGLCEAAAALASSTEWNRTAAAFKELQAKWKTIPNAGTQESELYARFRAAADTFFQARAAWFAERDRRFEAAIAAKNALVAEAENLSDVRRAKQLREEYRAAGPAGKAEAELYQRFNAALDRFFSARREAGAARETRSRELIAEIDRLAADPAAEGAASRIREIREELRTLACRTTFDAEKQAMHRFDRAVAERRGRENLTRFDSFRNTARAVAAAYQAVRSGAELPEPPPDLARFPKLEQAFQIIEAGELDRLNQLMAAAAADQQRIIAELTGNPAGNPAPQSLAAELEAAILGNFARKEAGAAARTVDPNRLLTEFIATGLRPAAELETALSDFERAFQKALTDRRAGN